MGRAVTANGKRVSLYGLRILRRLRSGASTTRLSDGSSSVGGLRAPGSLIRALESQDLLSAGPGGRLEISDPGLSFLRRQETNMKRLPGGGVGDQLDGFRRQHGRFALQKRTTAAHQRSAYINLAESPLGWLAKHKDSAGRPFITPRQMDAGERLRHDFETAGLRVSVTTVYDGIPIEKSKRQRFRESNPLDRQLDARERLNQAFAAVGPSLADSLQRTCCFLEGLEEVENGLGWPRRSAKVVLRIALDGLAAHYDRVDHRRRPIINQIGEN